MLAAMGIHREAVLPASPEETWVALTDPDALAGWFGATATVDLRPGGRVEFRWPDGSTRAGVFETIEPALTLAFRWLPFVRTPDGGSMQVTPTRVEFRLEPDPDGTRLTVTERAPSERVA